LNRKFDLQVRPEIEHHEKDYSHRKKETKDKAISKYFAFDIPVSRSKDDRSLFIKFVKPTTL
jgi:hypothetical protein